MNHFHRYDEIIHLPHPVSQTHPRMGRLERAAQFSPFAALTGYDDAVRETARLTDAQRELAEDEQALLERQLLRVQMLLDAGTPPVVAVTWFQPDAKKQGGAYVTAKGKVRKIDEFGGALLLVGGEKIPISAVIGIQLYNDKEQIEEGYEEYKANLRRTTENFLITDDHLGEGGPKAKFQANITAIKLLKYLEETTGQATPEQQKILSRYVGWGGLADAFDPEKPAWAAEYAQLKELLTRSEYAAARGSTLNAHYTSPTVIKAIYEAVGRMGFETGNILEPSCGVGNFFGMLPEKLRNSRLYGVELDSISGRIAKQLYPKADITVAGFETTDRRDFYDLAVGNVPFGQYQVRDKAYDKLNFSIHNYFFAKALDQVRPGGVVAFVTSRYTMDTKDSTVRRYLAQRAELLGAIRLPNNAFKANAGTEVVSDIIFLQKRDRPLDIVPEWTQTGQTQDGFAINRYCELLSITDENKRSFYEKESINSGWSVRELKRQIDSSLYERLLLSSGDANKEKVLSLAQKGIEINQPADIIRDPYVFEFLGVPENKPILESDLEKALVVQIEKFLLELGRGFMFVGTQQRVTLNNTHYYVDMVFYNKILRAYVLIELKTKKLTPEAAGQLNMYLNYYAAEVNDPDDNPPIGIILCTEKDSIAAEYALGGLSNNIFASRYVLYMPDKEQLIAQVEAVLKNWHEKKDNCHD